MKRLNSQHVSERTEKRLVQHRETLRRLKTDEMERVAGGAITFFVTCGTLKDIEI